MAEITEAMIQAARKVAISYGRRVNERETRDIYRVMRALDPEAEKVLAVAVSLRRYASHKSTCDLNIWTPTDKVSDGPTECSCGLWDAMDAISNLLRA